MYNGNTNILKANYEESKEYVMKLGVCIESTTLNTILDRAKKSDEWKHESRVLERAFKKEMDRNVLRNLYFRY